VQDTLKLHVTEDRNDLQQITSFTLLCPIDREVQNTNRRPEPTRRKYSTALHVQILLQRRQSIWTCLVIRIQDKTRI